MKKNKLILLQLFIAFVLICTSVYATVNATIDVSPKETTIEAGKDVSVKLSLKNVDKKVESIEGYINYNKDIIEKITVDNIEKAEDGTVTIGNETLKVEDVTTGNMPTSDYGVTFNGEPTSNNDSKIVIDFRNGIESDTDLLTINFKVKSEAEIGDIEKAISYSMFVITAGQETSEEITKDISLTVKAATVPKQDDGNTNKQPDSDKNTVNNSTNNTSNTNKVNNNTNNTNGNTNKINNNTNKNTNTKDNTVAGTTIPAAGAKLIVIPAIVLIVLAYIAYNKYRDMKDI